MNRRHLLFVFDSFTPDIFMERLREFANLRPGNVWKLEASLQTVREWAVHGAKPHDFFGASPSYGICWNWRMALVHLYGKGSDRKFIRGGVSLPYCLVSGMCDCSVDPIRYSEDKWSGDQLKARRILIDELAKALLEFRAVRNVTEAHDEATIV